MSRTRIPQHRRLHISQNSEGLWGATDCNGKIVLPFIYDEVRRFQEDYLYRIENQEGIYNMSPMKHKLFWEKPTLFERKYANREGVSRIWNIYSIPSRLTDEEKASCKPFDYLIYKDGKFGLQNALHEEILPCKYDYIAVWEDSDVIHYRQGKRHLYIDHSGRQILTKREARNFPCGSPFSLCCCHYLVREAVYGDLDEQCIILDGQLVRVERMALKDIFSMLQHNSKRHRLNKYVREDFIHNRALGPDVCVVKGNSIESCLEQVSILRHRVYSAFIDKVWTNKNTCLDDSELAKLKEYALTSRNLEKVFMGLHSYSYGVDDSLADGEIKLMHIEYTVAG